MRRLPTRIAIPRRAAMPAFNTWLRVRFERPMSSALTRMSSPAMSPMSIARSARTRLSVMALASPSWRARRSESPSAFLQAPDRPDPGGVSRKFVGSPPHSKCSKHFFERSLADELQQHLILGRTTERDLRSTRRIDEGPVQVLRDTAGTGLDDPRANFTRVASRIPDDESSQPTAVLGHQERRRKFLREPGEENSAARPEVLRIHVRQAGQLRGPNRANPANLPAWHGGPVPSDDHVLPTDTHALVAP